MNWSPDKITALVLVAGCLALVFTGIDGEVKAILTISAGYLFGVGIAEKKQQGGK